MNDKILSLLVKGNLKAIEGHDDYFVNEFGEVYRLFKSNKGDYSLRRPSISKAINGSLKYSMIVNGKVTTRLLHKDVYETFKGAFEGELQYIDGNKENCSLDNLISIKELIDFYRENNK